MAKRKTMSTVAAAVEVLKKARRPLPAGEIWARIQKSGIWSPPNGGTSPERTLAVQMSRASKGYAGSRPSKTKLFRRDENGRFSLLD